MTIFLTLTGMYLPSYVPGPFSEQFVGTKFVLLTSLNETIAEHILQRIYEAYSDAVMKNPFHTPEMPVRSEKFESRVGAIIGSGQT